MSMTRGILMLVLALAMTAPSRAEVEGRSKPRDTDPPVLQGQLVKLAAKIAAATVRVDTPDGMGSGTLIDAEGHILTSAHVIEGSRSVTVTLSDGRSFEAKVLGINSAGDLALLRISAEGLKPVDLGDSDAIKSRQWVVAAGHPVSAFDDFQPTISIGLVSKVDGIIRADRQKIFYGAIVSDTPLSPGSSGGGLFDLEGRLIAVNAAVTRNERGAFSVRIQEYLRDADRLRQGERFNRRAERVKALPDDEADGSSRTRTGYFSNHCSVQRDALAARQVEFARGSNKFSGLIVSEQGDVLVPARFTKDLAPGDLVAGFVQETEFLLSFVGADFTNGVALLRLPADAERPYFDLQQSAQVERGQLALALRGEWITGGIVAAAKRVPPLSMTDEVFYPHVVQVDLRLFRSDRGAGVVGLDGELIGMVVQHRLQEFSRSWAASPYGAFLLPPSLLQESFDLLRAGENRGERPVGFLGVGLEDMTESLKERLAVKEGVRVESAERNMPAWRAGIRSGDVILTIDGEEVASRGAAIATISSKKRGDLVPVVVRRQNETRTFNVLMAERSDFE